jgi:hypothetical protein
MLIGHRSVQVQQQLATPARTSLFFKKKLAEKKKGKTRFTSPKNWNRLQSQQPAAKHTWPVMLQPNKASCNE